ncbi:uncharacterized protein LOC127804762 [Diospyros lotus]|uniref:uncharacterized protein LOC127804762 n=1 Tax=Diospyros lotus TaxID=55363 RepID=UPI00224F2DB7|nr:uncharacterized protein LOC127804762 [Diospyros lotus]
MESTRLASLLLCVLYILQLHAKGGEMHADGLIATGENVIPVQKELSDIATAGARKMMLRDRKVKENEVLREEIEKQKEQNGETSRISGKSTNYNTLKRTGKSQDQYDDQKTISESSSSLGVSGKLQVSDKNVGAHDHDHDHPHEKDESQRLLDEAADEIVSMMRKDYRGMGRKPPINNHKPTD